MSRKTTYKVLTVRQYAHGKTTTLAKTLVKLFEVQRTMIEGRQYQQLEQLIKSLNTVPEGIVKEASEELEL